MTLAYVGSLRSHYAMINTSTHGPVSDCLDSVSRQLVAGRGLLDLLDRVISQSSIRLTSLLRIARDAFAINAGRQSWARPGAITPRAGSPPHKVNAPQSLAPHTPRRDPVAPALLHTFYRSAMPAPRQAAFPFPSSLALLLFKRHDLSGSYIPARPPQMRGLGGRESGAATIARFRATRSGAMQPVPAPAVTQYFGSRLAHLSPAYQRPPSPYGHPHAPQPEHGPPAAAPRYQRVDHQISGTIAKLAKISARAVRIAPLRPTPAAFRPSPVSGRPHVSPGGARNTSNTECGELMLEGSTLGRWLTRHLNQEIIRPPTGIIGVDPRITPAWPGPSFGR